MATTIDLTNTIKTFGNIYNSQDIVINNYGNSELFILDIICSLESFLVGIDLISETVGETTYTSAGESPTLHNVNLQNQYPKSIAVGDSITIQLKLRGYESVVLPAYLYIKTNEDGGRQRVFILKGTLPTSPKLEHNGPINFDNIVYPQVHIPDDNWYNISNIQSAGYGGDSYLQISGAFSFNSTDDNYLTTSDYIALKETDNYNGVHRVIEVSSESYIIVEYKSGIFRGHEWFGHWTRITNNPYYSTSNETYGSVASLLSPAMFKDGLILGASTDELKNEVQKLAITPPNDITSLVYKYHTKRIYGEGTNYSGKTIAILQLTKPGNRISNILNELGKDSLYHSIEGLMDGTYIEIKGSSVDASDSINSGVSGYASWVSNTEGNPDSNDQSKYFNRIHKIHSVVGAWKADSALTGLVGGSVHEPYNVSTAVTGNIYKVGVIGNSPPSPSEWLSLTGISNPTAGYTFTALEDGPSGSDSTIVLVDDVVIVVLDTPEVTYGNLVAFTPDFTGGSKGTFDLINDYRKLTITNTGKDTLKIKNIYDSGDYKLFEHPNIARETNTVGTSVPVPQAGYTTSNTSSETDIKEISPGNSETFYLSFNKTNFGSVFDRTTIEVEANYPEVYDNNNDLVYKKTPIDVHIGVQYPQIQVKRSKSTSGGYKRTIRNREILFTPCPEVGITEYSFEITNIGLSALYITDIELDGVKENTVDLKSNHNYEDPEKGDPLFRPQYYGQQSFVPFFIKNIDTASSTLKEYEFIRRRVYIRVTPGIFAAGSQIKGRLRIYCNSNPSPSYPESNIYTVRKGGFISINFRIPVVSGSVEFKSSEALISSSSSDSLDSYMTALVSTSLTNADDQDTYSESSDTELEATPLHIIELGLSHTGQPDGSEHQVFLPQDNPGLTEFSHNASTDIYSLNVYKSNIKSRYKNASNSNNGNSILIKTTTPSGDIKFKEHPGVIKIFDNSQEGAQKLGLTGTDLNYYYSSFKIYPVSNIGFVNPNMVFTFANETLYLKNDSVIWQWIISKIDDSTNTLTAATETTDYVLYSYDSTESGSSNGSIDSNLGDGSTSGTKHLRVGFVNAGKIRIELKAFISDKEYSSINDIKVISYSTTLDNLNVVFNPMEIDFGSLEELSTATKYINIYNPTTTDRNFRIRVSKSPPTGVLYYGDSATVSLDNRELGQDINFTLEKTETNGLKAISGFTYPETADSVDNLIKVTSTAHGLTEDDSLTIFDDSNGNKVLDGEYICLAGSGTNDFYIKPKSIPATNGSNQIVVHSSYQSTIAGHFLKGKISSKSIAVTLNTTDYKNSVDLIGSNMVILELLEHEFDTTDSLTYKNIYSYVNYTDKNNELLVLVTTTAAHSFSIGDVVTIKESDSQNYNDIDFIIQDININSGNNFVVNAIYDPSLSTQSIQGKVYQNTLYTIPVTAKYKLTEKRMDDDLTLTKVEQKTPQDMDSTADDGNTEDTMINMMKESQRFWENFSSNTRKNDP